MENNIEINMTTENTVKIKFVEQEGKIPYEKHILSLDELTKSEQQEVLKIFLRLKKRTYYGKLLLKDFMENFNNGKLSNDQQSILSKTENFLKINK